MFSEMLMTELARDPIFLVDIGARGGLDADLASIARAVVAIGFEPHPDEANALTSSPPGDWLEQRILPWAIAGTTGEGTLHVPAGLEGASLLPHNDKIIQEFGHEHLHRTLQQLLVRTIRLDDLAVSGELTKADYIKIDIEGAELDVLKAGGDLVRMSKVLKVECSFLEQRIGQPLAHEVTGYMATIGFELIDVLYPYRWRRRPLPAHPYVARHEFPYSRGRLAQADLIFARKFEVDASALEVRTCVVVLVALGYIDQAMTLLRRFPAVVSSLANTGIDLEAEIRVASRVLGRRASREAVFQQVRNMVPLIRSWTTGLPSAKLKDPY